MSGQQENPKKLTIQSYKKKKKKRNFSKVATYKNNKLKPMS